jgi:hypothetical protein
MITTDTTAAVKRLRDQAADLDVAAKQAKTPGWREACDALAVTRRRQADTITRRQLATW